MALSSTDTELVGRDAATRTIDLVLDGGGPGGGVIIVRGEAGIGKSAILSAARASAERRRMLVLSCSGVPSETHVAFAGLSQLLRPILAPGKIDLGPDNPLRAAVGPVPREPPELFRIALATLDALAARADQRPLLLSVDDIQWVDQETADILAFLARRITNDPIFLVAARRDGWPSALDNLGFPELHLEPLDDRSARELLDKRAAALAPWMRESILAAAAGNPLALTELPTALEGVEIDPLAPLPLNERLELAFASRFRELPSATRNLLLLSALNDSASVAEIVAAAQLADEHVGLEDVAPAAAARLVELDLNEMRFRHPLMRAAVIQGSGLEERLSAHRLLGSALSNDSDRAIWHRAASTAGPDSEIAAELEAAAARSRGRGALEASRIALERAAQMSEATDDCNRRLLSAALLSLELGQPATAERLIEQIPPANLSPVDAGRRALIRESIAPGPPDDEDAAIRLLDHVDRMRAEGEVDLALELLWIAANSGFWADRAPRSGQGILDSLSRFSLPASDPRVLSVTAYAAPTDRGSDVLDRIGATMCDARADPKLTGLIANAAVTLGALDLAIPFLDAAVDGLRRQGRLGALAQTLVLRGWASIQLGRLDLAELDAAEAVRLARETHQPIWEGAGYVIEAMLFGYRASVDEAGALLSEAEGIGLNVGGRALLNVVQLARGAIFLSNGHDREAFDSLIRMFDPVDPSYHRVESCWAIGLLADAAVSSGRQPEVRPLLAELEPLARHMNSPWFLVAVRHAGASLAAPEEADDLFAAAFEADLTHWPLDWALLQLAYGKRLRREKRLADSRAALRKARDAFDGLGAVAWGQRARDELRSAGETSGPRVARASEQLTPQELQIARFAADGLTNREIADRLYLSPRTVGSHLYRIFPKLGITERTQLVRALQRTAQDDG